MNSFGDKATFGIEYQTEPEMYPDDEEIINNIDEYKTYGSMYFWVNGRNLFLFKGFGPEATYTADLCIIIQAFCKNLICYLKDDTFPAKTKATTGVSMMNELKLVEGAGNYIEKYLALDWDKVDVALYDAINDWNRDHGLVRNRCGTFLPDIFIRRVESLIEISWSNDFSYKTSEGELFFEYKQGAEYIDIAVFKKVMVEFCQHFIKVYEDKYPQAAKRDRDNLQKAIDFVV